MDEKIKTWPLCFPAKETLIWRRHCSIGQSCCSMTSKKFLESSSGMKFVYPRVRLANQNPGEFVSVSYTNQIALFPFVCCFCFVRTFSFQGHTKIALIRAPWHVSLVSVLTGFHCMTLSISTPVILPYIKIFLTLNEPDLSYLLWCPPSESAGIQYGV